MSTRFQTVSCLVDEPLFLCVSFYFYRPGRDQIMIV